MKKHTLMFACSFFFALGHNFLNFSLIYRLTDMFFLNPGQVGTFMASGQIFYFLGLVLYHRFGSTIHPVKIIFVASVLVLTASIPLGFARVLGLAQVSFWLLQFASSLFWPPVMAWLTEGLSGNELGQKISYFNRSWMAALIVAPPLAGYLYAWNYNFSFFFISFMFFTNLLLIVLIRRSSSINLTEREQRASTHEHSETDAQNPTPEIWSKKNDLYRYIAWLSFFFSVMLAGFLITVVPLHIRDGLGHTEGTAGWLLLFRCVAGFIGFILLAKFTRWHFNFSWFIILQAGLAFCAFLFLIAGSQLSFYFGIVFLYGLVNAACNTSSVFYSRATGKNPKKNLALHEMFLCAATATGTAGGGLLYQHFGFTGTSLVLLLLMSIIIGVFALLIQRHRRLYK